MASPLMKKRTFEVFESSSFASVPLCQPRNNKLAANPNIPVSYDHLMSSAIDLPTSKPRSQSSKVSKYEEDAALPRVIICSPSLSCDSRTVLSPLPDSPDDSLYTRKTMESNSTSSLTFSPLPFTIDNTPRAFYYASIPQVVSSSKQEVHKSSHHHASTVSTTIELYVGERHPITGYRHGRGDMSYKNGCKYIGQFVNDMRHGQGKCMYPNNLGYYTGQWYKNVKSGVGSMTYANGDIYVGEWSNDRHYGKGKLTMKGGAQLYEGDFVNNKKQGRGLQTNTDNGDVYIGLWYNDVRHGIGMLKSGSSRISHCLYHHGVLVSCTPK